MPVRPALLIGWATVGAGALVAVALWLLVYQGVADLTAAELGEAARAECSQTAREIGGTVDPAAWVVTSEVPGDSVTMEADGMVRGRPGRLQCIAIDSAGDVMALVTETSP